MHLRSIALTLFMGSCSTATALIESNSTSDYFATYEYVDPELQQVSDWNVAERASLTGEEGDTIHYVDGRSGKPVVFFPEEGDASVLPGDGVGNRLLWSVGTEHDRGFGVPDHDTLSEAAVTACKNWITNHQGDLGIDVSELFADGMVRTSTHPDGDIQLSLTRTFNGVEVVGSRVAINIVGGNIATVAVEQWGEVAADFDLTTTITAQDAMNVLAEHTGRALTGETSCDSQVQVLTLTNDDDIRPSTGLRGITLEPLQVINGYKHNLAWKVCPKFEGQGDAHSFQGYVDAHTKKILEFKNTIDLFEAEGGVYPPGDTEQPEWPMSYMRVGYSLTDVGGNFNTAGAATFRGKFVRLFDQCGGASLGLNEGNSINWGTSRGRDCNRGEVNGQGVGGGGNTPASRTTYYHTTHIADIARRHLPNEFWLKTVLIANVNIDKNCNAYWNGQINFYTSGGGCSNFGEISGIIAHEWGHGLDANDVEGGISKPSGEGIADLYAAFYDGTSCIGRGGLNRICKVKGDPCKFSAGCNGVRDIDYMQHNSESPHTMTWARNNCEKSVHCKGHVYSEAVWSLYKRELPKLGYDDLTSFELTTYLLYKAAGNVRAWYNENAAAPWGGCGGFTGYRAFLAADDNDGNLGNGTPHMTAIYKAFLDQEIACNDLVVRNSGCTNGPVGAPQVTATPRDKRITLTWTQVNGALSYDVMRAEGGCEKGKVKVANVRRGNGNLLFLTDTGLKNGFEYCYLIVPKGTAAPSSCYGKKSTKVLVKPGGSTLPIPDTPPPTRRPTPLPTRFPTPLPTRLPTPLPTRTPTPLPTRIPTPLPTRLPTPLPTATPTPIPTNPQPQTSPPIGSSETICNVEDEEKIFKLNLEYPPEIATQLNWKVNKFNVETETFDDYKSSGDSVRPEQRVCVPPGTYEVVISDNSNTGMSGGSYLGYFRGGLIFSSDAAGVNWGEQRHIFCYGECASTTPSMSPSKKPTLRPSPTELPLPNQQDAEYDPVLNVPKCSTASHACSTGELVTGRGALGPENGSPNSLDGCTDSNAGNYEISESIEKITVSSNTQSNMREGDTVTVTAKVICWYTGANDTADFYYTASVDNLNWVYIGSVDCSGVFPQAKEGEDELMDQEVIRPVNLQSKGKEQDLSVSYTLPKGSQQAVRVNFSYRIGERDATSSCVESTVENQFYNDVDDLVFTVEEENTEVLI